MHPVVASRFSLALPFSRFSRLLFVCIFFCRVSLRRGVVAVPLLGVPGKNCQARVPAGFILSFCRFVAFWLNTISCVFIPLGLSLTFQNTACFVGKSKITQQLRPPIVAHSQIKSDKMNKAPDVALATLVRRSRNSFAGSVLTQPRGGFDNDFWPADMRLHAGLVYFRRSTC